MGRVMELRSSSKRHIDKLPEELLTKIFLLSPPLFNFSPCGHSYLPPIGNVSRRWRRLLLSTTVCRQANLRVPKKCPATPEGFAVLHQIAAGLRELNICGISTYSHTPFASLLPNLPAFPKVKKLRLNEVPRLTQVEWAGLVEKFPLVESFTSDGKNKWLDDGSLQLMAAGWPQLVEFEVELADCNKLTGAGLIEFVTVANRLQSISLDGIRDLTDRHVDMVTRRLGDNLKSIVIGPNQDDLTGSAVQSVVENCPQLESIDISKLNIGPVSDLIHLQKFLVNFHAGPCEGLNNCFCRPFAQLRELQLYHAAQLTDSHLTRIANSCPVLETFSLCVAGNPNRFVTDSGVDQLLIKCKNLTWLVLEGCPLLTGRSFIRVREKLPKLTQLRLLECANVDADMVRAEFPDVEIR